MSNLQEAYEAIQSGDLVTAQAIAADVLKTDQQNAEAWFILSEATEGDRKLVFLNKAIKLDPSLTIAHERLTELQKPAVPEPVLPTADFDHFGAPEPEPELKITKDWQEALKKPLPEVKVVAKPEPTPEPAAVVSTPTSKPTPKTPAQPSQLYNTLGIGVSALLALMMLILFIQALLSYF